MNHFETMHFVAIAIPLIARIAQDRFTISGTYTFGPEHFCASFDFHQSLLPQLLELFSEPARSLAADALARAPFSVDLRAVLPHATISCKLGDHIEATHDQAEQFCPFGVTKFQ